MACDQIPDRPPPWPPDAFALTAFVLQQSGAYVRALSDLPKTPTAASWQDHSKAIGAAWRATLRQGDAFDQPEGSPPSEIGALWRHIVSGDLTCDDLHSPKGTSACDALLKIFAYADEACAGMGIPGYRAESRDDALSVAWNFLLLHGTFCTANVSDRIRVLPKMHTPKVGCTLRSLSKNLAFYIKREVDPRWFMVDRDNTASSSNSLNLLLVPWPREVYPSHFQEVRKRMPPRPHEMNESGLFTYSRDPWVVGDYARLLALANQARRQVGHIDGVVFPELALTVQEWDFLKFQTGPGSPLPELLVAGVGKPARLDGKELGENYAGVAAWAVGADTHREREFPVIYEQHKHHRWLLDAQQVRNYHLGAKLNGAKSWWEAIRIAFRKVHFLALAEWLTLCVLLCEDLARQDPVSELLRAVGPNLVIVLLMDGPQMPSRWPGRYATVLADDPGSAVLTLTSVGMACRSRPSNVEPRSDVARTIGLWKDSRRGETTPIVLPPDGEAVVLTISRTSEERKTLDGRIDRYLTTNLELTGIQVLSIDPADHLDEADHWMRFGTLPKL